MTFLATVTALLLRAGRFAGARLLSNGRLVRDMIHQIFDGDFGRFVYHRLNGCPADGDGPRFNVSHLDIIRQSFPRMITFTEEEEEEKTKHGYLRRSQFGNSFRQCLLLALPGRVGLILASRGSIRHSILIAVFQLAYVVVIWNERKFELKKNRRQQPIFLTSPLKTFFRRRRRRVDRRRSGHRRVTTGRFV